MNAHGGGIVRVCDTFYLHGEFFLSTTTDNNFNGFAMYSSKDLATWKNEGIVLPQQPSGELGPNRKGERPHIVRCPATGEFILYAHAADTTYQVDKEVVYATSPTVNGVYKLVAARQGGEWRGVWKRSADKATVPGAKQVFRASVRGTITGDVIGAADEDLDGEPLLRPAMRDGEAIGSESLEEIRARTAAQLAALPAALRQPGSDGAAYPARYSDRLRAAIRPA